MILKLIIIFVVLYTIGSVIWVRRVVTAAKSKSTQPVELKACEFCGMLVRVDNAIKVQGRIFCCQDHAKQFIQP